MLVAKLLGELLWIGARKDVDHAFLAIWQLDGHLEDDTAAWFGGGGWSVHIFGGESKGAVFVGRANPTRSEVVGRRHGHLTVVRLGNTHDIRIVR